uniref:Glycosyl transferase 64 domain-containing protein n=1 Tax=Leersia perrieri TaxID=77586 RepID=A0A0D9UZS7_9ORYZ
MAAPRRRGLPLRLLLLLLPVSLFVFILLHHRSSVPGAPPLLAGGAGPSPDPRRFSLLIKVLAYDRPASLRRCLRSLAAADYAGDRVALHVLVDHPPAPAPTNASLAASRETLAEADALPWPHGEKRVHYRAANAGLQAQWIEAWWPGSDDEFAFVVEDDLEVSPLYYRFLKRVVMKYYYDRSNYSPYVFGASLQRPRFVAGKHGNKIQLDSETHLFLYQMVGTWGQLLFPKPWKEFRLWYDEHKSKGIKPILEGMKTTGWYKKMGERIWTPWFIKFVHSHGYFNFYTNFLKERALSVSHRDAGVNYGRSVGPDSTLLDGKNLDFNIWELQPLNKLKWYNFCFTEVLPGRVVRKFRELGSVLKSVQLENNIVLISLYSIEQRIARNLICHLEKAGIQNYIFLIDNPEFLDDLAHRGHPVIDATGMLQSIKMSSSMYSDDFVKEIVVKAYVIKNCLDLGYNLWVLNGNMISLGSKLIEPSDQSFDLFAAESVDSMFLRGSQDSKRTWNELVILRMADGMMSSRIDFSSALEHKNFVHMITKAFGNSGVVRLGKLDEAIMAAELGPNASNRSLSEDHCKDSTNLMWEQM